MVYLRALRALSATLLLFGGLSPLPRLSKRITDVIDFLDGHPTGRIPANYYLTTSELIAGRGYDTEEHKVVTEDGYVLELTRVIGPRSMGGTPVLVMHAIFMTSQHLLLMNKELNMIFLLCDAGYDVWLGNFRGNNNTRAHINYSANDPQFWDFSYDEMALKDVPALMDRIAEVSGSGKMLYIGYSLGTLVFLAMAASLPEYGSRVPAAALLAPVAFSTSSRSLGEPVSALIQGGNKFYRNLLERGTYELMPWEQGTSSLLRILCSLPQTQQFCVNGLGITVGENRNNWDMKKFGYYFSSLPCGSSSKTLYHAIQNFKYDRFTAFDYGRNINLAKYGSEAPPLYNLSNIRTAVGLYYGLNDRIVDIKSINKLMRYLPNVARNYIVQDFKFTHFDFIAGLNTKRFVYNDILQLFKTFQ